MRRAILAICILALAGCFESEESCYQRLHAEFTDSFEWAMEEADKIRRNDAEESLRYLDYAKIASNSSARILTIWLNDNMDACDYFKDGPYLRRK